MVDAEVKCPFGICKSCKFAKLASGVWKSRQNHFKPTFCFNWRPSHLMLCIKLQLATNKEYYICQIGIIIDSSYFKITSSKIFFAKFLSFRSKHGNYSCCCSTHECMRVGAKNYLLFSRDARFRHLIWNNNSPQTKNVSLSYGYRCLCWSNWKQETGYYALA